VVVVRIVLEKEAVIFVFIEVLAEEMGERVDKMKNFFTADPACQYLGKFFIAGELEKTGKGLSVKIFGQAEAHLI
jgi:hypothetical protein